MQILITGASGFVGPYLARELANHGHDVVLTAPEPFATKTSAGQLEAKVCDLTDLAATKALIKDIQPEAVVHLASLSHVGHGWHDRPLLVNVNINATSHVCQAVEATGRPTVFLFVSSAQVYRPLASGHQTASGLNEMSLPEPRNPYGASKLAAESVVRSFTSAKFKPYIVRPFNHIGPGQSRAFVCPAFAHRILQMTHAGRIAVGNLASRRDFSDVRDIVRAYRLILELQPSKDLFVLGSGQRLSIEEVLQKLVLIAGKDITPELDANLLRPHDPDVIVADPSRAREELGWSTSIAIDETLREIYEEAKRSYV